MDDVDFSTDLGALTVANGSTNISQLEHFTEIELKGFVTENPDLWFYQLVHLSLLGLMLLLGFIKGFWIAVVFLKGATKMHDQMLQR